MTHYHNLPDYVRVDFFKPSGKWYTTESVKWLEYMNNDIVETFKESLREHFKQTPNRLSEMSAICLHPYSRYPYPVCIHKGEWRK